MACKRVYACPLTGRTGLSNMLFPWARAEVFSRRHRAEVLAPHWTKLMRLGPWLRGERDKRYYWAQFSNNGYISGLQKWLIIQRSSVIAEDNFSDTASGRHNSVVVTFRGMEGFFDSLLGEQVYLKERLLTIAAPAVRRQLAVFRPAPFIGVHVRRSDFRQAGWAVDDQWYLLAVSEALAVAKAAGHERIDIRIFSDAPLEELSFIARAFENVTIMEPAPALVDLLRLSLSNWLVGTSNSTFSMWAAFLGGMPSCWHATAPPPRINSEGEVLLIS